MKLLYRNRVSCLFNSFKNVPFFSVKQCPQICLDDIGIDIVVSASEMSF